MSSCESCGGPMDTLETFAAESGGEEVEVVTSECEICGHQEEQRVVVLHVPEPLPAA